MTGERPPASSSEQDLLRLFEAAPVPLILTRVSDSTILMLNRLAATTFETDPEEAVGRPAVDFYVRADDRARFLQAMSGKGHVDHMELELKTAGGRPLWASVSATLVDFRGEKVVMVGVTDLTERRRMEDTIREAITALRQSEERFREESDFRSSIIQNAAEGLCVCHAVDDHPYVAFTVWNRRMDDITGYTLEEINAKGWYQALYPDPEVQARAQARMARMRVGDDLKAETWEITRKDGQRRTVQITTSLLQAADGNAHVLALIDDVTEQHRAEAARRESEKMLRLVLDTIPVRVFWKDKDLRYLGINRKVAEDAGLDAAVDVAGRTDYDFAWAEQAEQYRSDDRLVMESGRPKLNYEEPLSTHDGSVIWARTSKFPLRDAAGEVVGILGTFEDITERKVVEEGRRVLAERLALATQAAAIGIWELDLVGQALHVDDQFVALYGGVADAWEPAELWTDRLHPEDRAVSAERRRAAMAAETPIYDDEVRVAWPDGTRHHVRNLGRLVRDAQGAPVRLVGVSMDITAAKRAEEDIRQLNVELERRVAERTTELSEANRELESFSYSVSHDLRAPLRAIDGFSQALVEDFGHRMDDTSLGHLRRVRLASQRMGQLIDDLMNLSRTSRAELRRRPIDLSSLAETVFGQLRAAHPERRVAVTVAPGLSALADESLTRALLENLIGNAWKYTSKNDEARIEVGSGPRPGVFFVKDDGVGFDPAYTHKLFGPFQRLHGSDEFEGTGIGLATVQRIVRRHGGRAWGEGQPGRGATFYFTLAPEGGLP